jgi:hypothetical protein
MKTPVVLLLIAAAGCKWCGAAVAPALGAAVPQWDQAGGLVFGIVLILGAALCLAYVAAPFMLYGINGKLGRIERHLAEMNQRSAAGAAQAETPRIALDLAREDLDPRPPAAVAPRLGDPHFSRFHSR